MTGEKNVSLGNIGQPAQCPCKLVKTSSELNFICKITTINKSQIIYILDEVLEKQIHQQAINSPFFHLS